MTAFTESELRYLLQERLLARIATVGVDGTRHIAPVGWSFNREHDAIDAGGQRLERTKKYRDVERTGRAGLVIDDVLPPWRPRASRSAGGPKVVTDPVPLIRIHPECIVSWGLESEAMGSRHARTVVARPK